MVEKLSRGGCEGARARGKTFHRDRAGGDKSVARDCFEASGGEEAPL